MIGSWSRCLRWTPRPWDAWHLRSIRDYAADMVRVGAWSSEGAEERAAELFARLVPDGRATRGHEFRSIVTETNEAVGALWFATEGEVGRGTAFIWDIAIDEQHRGRGYGRAAMEALEPLARSLGYDAIRLHVFGDNAIARRLYRAAGYAETDVTMMKRIAADPGPGAQA
jgi:ribosomal protein S18 acetylase RimI-like enzyme